MSVPVRLDLMTNANLREFVDIFSNCSIPLFFLLNSHMAYFLVHSLAHSLYLQSKDQISQQSQRFVVVITW